MVYNSNRAYPEYIITFKKKSSAARPKKGTKAKAKAKKAPVKKASKSRSRSKTTKKVPSEEKAAPKKKKAPSKSLLLKRKVNQFNTKKEKLCQTKALKKLKKKHA